MIHDIQAVHGKNLCCLNLLRILGVVVLAATFNYRNIYFLGPHACWGCPEKHRRLACLNLPSSVCYIHCLLHRAALDKVQELCGLVTSSLWPQLSPTLDSSSKLFRPKLFQLFQRAMFLSLP